MQKNKGPFSEIEVILDYHFINKNFLKQALIAKSHSNERPYKDQSEFQTLGDAVLKLVLTELMIEQGHTTEASITLGRISFERKEGLAETARKLGINPFIVLGEGQKSQNNGDSDHVLAETLEAIAGAIHHDGEFDNTKEVMKILVY